MAFERNAVSAIEQRLTFLEAHRGRLVIDGDVHPTDFAALPRDMAERVTQDPNYFHGRPLLSAALLATMDLARVDISLCWQNPATLPYGEDQEENARRLGEANARIAALAAAALTRAIPAGWTDPKALGVGNAIALARACVQVHGMPIVKMNPAQNAYPIDDPMVLEVVDAIVSMGAVPAFHFGADTPFTPAEGLERVAARHPDHPVIGVHMGGGGAHFIEAEATYQAARALGLRRPNVFYILSAIRDPHIESALISYAKAGEPFCCNLAVGSDAPYGNMVWNFGGFRALFEALADGNHYGDPRLAQAPDLFSQEMIKGFMGRNLADLVIAADRRILALADRQ